MDKGNKEGQTAVNAVMELPLDDIDVSHNVREVEVDDDLRLLAGSIASLGLLNPVSVVPAAKSPWKTKQPWVLTAGGRRWRAHKLLKGVKTIKAIAVDLTHEQVRAAQLVENLQRVDLNPVDEARAMDEWMKATKLGPKDLGKEIGKSDDYVRSRTNILRLPEPVVKNVESGALNVRHAMALLKAPKEATELVEQIAKDAVDRKITAEAVERNMKFAVDNWKEQRKEAEQVSSLAFKVCPVDKQPPEGGIEWNTKDVLTCSGPAGHRWHGSTGKLVQERAGTSSDARPSAKKRPSPVDLTEPVTVPVSADAAAVLRAMVDSAGASGIESAVLEKASYGGPSRLVVRFRKGSEPVGATVGLRPVKYTTGARTLLHVSPTGDSRQRHKERDAVKAWARKAGVKAAAGKSSATVDGDGTLRGGVEDVAKRLGRLTPEQLELLRAAEVAGKGRNGVLDAIDGELSVLGNRKSGSLAHKL